MIVKCSMRQCSLTPMQAHTVACWGLFSNTFVDLHLNLILRSFMSFITLHEQVLRIPFATFTPAIYSSEISLNRRHLTDFPSYNASTSASWVIARNQNRKCSVLEVEITTLADEATLIISWSEKCVNKRSQTRSCWLVIATHKTRAFASQTSIPPNSSIDIA